MKRLALQALGYILIGALVMLGMRAVAWIVPSPTVWICAPGDQYLWPECGAGGDQ
jgi:hypothetical protein